MLSDKVRVAVKARFAAACCSCCLYCTDYTHTTAEGDAISVADSQAKGEHFSAQTLRGRCSQFTFSHSSHSLTETNLLFCFEVVVFFLNRKSAPRPLIFNFASSPPCLGALLSAESTLDSKNRAIITPLMGRQHGHQSRA